MSTDIQDIQNKKDNLVKNNKKPFMIRDILGPKIGSKHSNLNQGQTDFACQPIQVQSKCQQSLPAWIFCTRYSDRPSAGPRQKRRRMDKAEKSSVKQKCDRKPVDESDGKKRPRTAFTNLQLEILQREFELNKYLNESRRIDLASRLDLAQEQVKIWFQNKRAKLKKNLQQPGTLAQELRAQGLYRHKFEEETQFST